MAAKCPIYFEIIKTLPRERSVEVKYFTDNNPEGATYNVTLYPDPIPTGEDLIRYIMSYAPKDWLYIKEETSFKLPDLSELEAMKGRVFSEPQVVETPSREEQLPLPGEVIAKVIRV